MAANCHFLETTPEQAFLSDVVNGLQKNQWYVNFLNIHLDRLDELAAMLDSDTASDYDGVGDSLPIGLKDVSDYPNLIAELMRRGYSNEDLEKICYKNVFRVWNAVEKAAAS